MSIFGNQPGRISVIKIRNFFRDRGLNESLPVFQGDTSKECPPLRQFDTWWTSVRDTALQTFSACTKLAPSLRLREETQCHEAMLSRILSMKTALFISAKSYGTGSMNLVNARAIQMYCRPMDHINIIIPLDDTTVEYAIRKLRLTEVEGIEVDGDYLALERVFRYLDLDKPFLHTHWAAKVGLLQSLNEPSSLCLQPLRMFLESDVLAEGWHKKLDDLSAFISGLPLMRPRTFSSASSGPSHTKL